MTTFIKRHALVAYYVVTFVISWGVVLLVVGGPGGIPGTPEQFERLLPFVIPALLGGPSLAGLLLIGLVDGRAGFRELLSRVLRWRVGARSYAVAILTAPLLMGAIPLVVYLFVPEFLPGIFIKDDKASLLVLAVAAGLGAGIFEEIGWTGFAIPRLRLRQGALSTGLIVGGLWGAWHLVVNLWSSGTPSGSLSLALLLHSLVFSLGVLPAYRVLMVWVYERTGSLLVAVLMHTSLTMSNVIFAPVATGGPLVAWSLVMTAALWVVVAAVVVTNRGRQGEPRPGGIAEASYLRLGGRDQWVMMRGESLANPPLILLHGGPGFTETFLFRHFNAPLERHFTLVYWDQRGTGKSFDRSIPRSSMTVEQFIADLDDLVEAVRKRVGRDKVVIFGHSWGSALGVLYAGRFPEKVAVYVGSGQIGDWSAGESLSYGFALAEAERLENRKALKALRAIGPPPHSASRLWIERTWLQRLEGRFGARSLWKMGRVFLSGLGAPESSIFDLPNTLRGFRFSIDAMWTEVSKLNLATLVPALEMPVFLFLGRRDHWVPPETSVAYLEALVAPSKKLVWFEASGHEPFADEPEKFNAAMVEWVRPAV